MDRRPGESEEEFINRHRAENGLAPIPDMGTVTPGAAGSTQFQRTSGIGATPGAAGSTQFQRTSRDGVSQIIQAGEGENGGVDGKCIWATAGGQRLVLHGRDSEHFLTLENGGEIIFSLPREADGPDSLGSQVREIVRQEIQAELRKTTAAEIAKQVKVELGAREEYRATALQVAEDLRDMEFGSASE